MMFQQDFMPCAQKIQRSLDKVAYTTIDDPSAYFQIALWTGNGSTQSITNDGNSDLQPDFIWTKRRTAD